MSDFHRLHSEALQHSKRRMLKRRNSPYGLIAHLMVPDLKNFRVMAGLTEKDLRSLQGCKSWHFKLPILTRCSVLIVRITFQFPTCHFFERRDLPVRTPSSGPFRETMK